MKNWKGCPDCWGTGVVGGFQNPCSKSEQIEAADTPPGQEISGPSATITIRNVPEGSRVGVFVGEPPHRPSGPNTRMNYRVPQLGLGRTTVQVAVPLYEKATARVRTHTGTLLDQTWTVDKNTCITL